MIALKYEILNMLHVNHMNEWEDYYMNIHTCAPYEWRWWDYDSQNMYMLHVHDVNEDDETIIHLNICFMCST